MDQSNEMIELSAKSISLLAERGIQVTLDVYDPTPKLSSIQIIDGADNATFSIFQASAEEFTQLFPNGQDIEIAEAVPTSKREVDFDDSAINQAQRRLFAEWR